MEHIELSVYENEDGQLEIRDQHGRTVKGLRKVVAIREIDEVNTLIITAIDYRNGKARTAGSK